mmetsp:Transcript_14198/g.59819  ORF Transcript_14198/g.59819 Transcript_14198/m.59819 type:complete len:225 (-) Transcript_14198:366-1040(-)
MRPARRMRNSFISLNSLSTRRILSLPTSPLLKMMDRRSKGMMEMTSMVNQPLRYVLMIVGWWNTSWPSSGSTMATKKLRKMSRMNSKSTDRLIQNKTLHRVVSRNATSTGVTTAVNISSTRVTRSHLRMYHVRGEITRGDFSMNALCLDIICAPTATCITSNLAFPMMLATFFPPFSFSSSAGASNVDLICLCKSSSFSCRSLYEVSVSRFFHLPRSSSPNLSS